MRRSKNTEAARLQMGAARIETQGQREGLRREIARFAGSDRFKNGVIRMQAERLKAQREKLLEAHLADVLEFDGYRQDASKMPADRKELARFVALSQKFAEKTGYAGVPGAADVHTDQKLTTILIDEPQGEFIADLVSPLFPVDKRSDLLPRLKRSGLKTAWDVRRSPGTPAKTGGWDYASNTTYLVVNRAFGYPIPDETIQNQDAPYDVGRDSARYCEEIVRTKREADVRDLLTTAANYPATHQLSTTTKWDDADSTNVEPRNDVQTLKNLIRKACGRVPNSMILNFPMAQAVCNLDDFRDRFKHVAAVTESFLMDELMSYFDVENLYIGMAMEDTASVGQTEVYADIWPDDAVVFYQERPGLFSSTLSISPCTDPGSVMAWRNPDPSARAEHVAFELDCDEIIVNSNCGGHINDTLT